MPYVAVYRHPELPAAYVSDGPYRRRQTAAEVASEARDGVVVAAMTPGKAVAEAVPPLPLPVSAEKSANA